MSSVRTPQSVARSYSKKEELLRVMWQRALADPEVYLFGDRMQRGFVKTVDEHDQANPVKPFPDRPHLRVLNQLWTQSQQLLIPKSRQLMVSWFCMARASWEIMHPGQQWAVTCKKFDDANSLLERCWLIIQNIPEPLRPKAIRKEGLIKIEHETAPSTLLALSQDSDSPRSRTFSGIILDEAAFTDNLDKLYTSARPTVQGGGKLIMVSTPNGRDLFYNLATDNGRLEL